MRSHVGVSLQLPFSVHVTDGLLLEKPGPQVNIATLPNVVLEKAYLPLTGCTGARQSVKY